MLYRLGGSVVNENGGGLDRFLLSLLRFFHNYLLQTFSLPAASLFSVALLVCFTHFPVKHDRISTEVIGYSL